MPKPGYTDAQRCEIIELRFRDKPRPAPWQTIATAIGVTAGDNVIERVLWGTVTGYPTTNDPADAPRPAPVWPAGLEHYRAGQPWHQPEKDALQMALGGEGQLRHPPVDIPYIAQVLARTVAEVKRQWDMQKSGGLQREGFFG